MKEKVSVIMTAYNSELTICEAIDSILNQSYSNLELIIVDDGSTDSTINLIKQYADQRIKLFQLKENVGLARALNFGFSKVKGEFIARMDSDDVSTKDRIEIQVKFLHGNSEIDLVGSYAYLCDKNLNVIGELKKPLNFSLIKDYIKYQSPCIHPTWMFRKCILESNHLYNEKLIVAQDYDFLARLVLNGIKINNIPQKTLYYRQIKSSSSSRNHYYQLLFANAISLKYRLSLNNGLIYHLDNEIFNKIEPSYFPTLVKIRFYFLKIQKKNYIYKMLCFMPFLILSLADVVLFEALYRTFQVKRLSINNKNETV